MCKLHVNMYVYSINFILYAYINIIRYFVIISEIILYCINVQALMYIYTRSYITKVTWTTLPHIVYSVVKLSKLKYIYYNLIVAIVGIPVFICLFFITHAYITPLRNTDYLVLYVAFMVFLMCTVIIMTPIYLKTVKFNPTLAQRRGEVSPEDIFTVKVSLVLLHVSVQFHAICCIAYILNH